MNILFVSDNFPPEVNAPASRTFEHARRWVEKGDSVTVITCAPNFPKGKVHDGYSNDWRCVEMISGIRVVRVKTFITGNEGFALRILDYVSFMLSAFLFGLFEKRPDIIVGTSPQFFSAVSAWMLSVFKRRPFVFELRDLWPASIVTVGAMKKGVAIRLLERLELFLYRRASLIVSVTESFVEDLVARGIDRGKIKVVRNGVDLEVYQPRQRSPVAEKRYGVANRFVVSYLGTHGLAHALDLVVDAAGRLTDIEEIVFLLVGDGADKARVRQYANDRDCDNVLFFDSVPKSEMPDLWSLADVALVHLKDDPVFATVIPSKLFEAFGMGRPVLLVQPDGEAAEILRSTDAGLWIPAGDPALLADACRALFEDRAWHQSLADASAAAAERFSRDMQAESMRQLLHGYAG